MSLRNHDGKITGGDLLQLGLVQSDSEGTLSALGGYTPAIPTRRWLPELNGVAIVDTMATGWTANNNSGTITLADTLEGPLAATSIKIVSPSAGTAPTADLTGTFDLSTGSILVWVNYQDIVDADGNNPVVVFIAGDSTLTNFYSWSWKPPTANPGSLMVPDSGWFCKELSLANVASTTGTPNLATIGKMRVRVNTGGTQSHTVNFGGVGHKTKSTVYANGVVSFCFDDGNASDWSLARPALAKYGIGASAYPICDRVDSGFSTDMTSAHYRQMVDQLGWEVNGHAFTTADHDARFTTLSDSVLDTEFKNMRTWLQQNGFAGEAWASPGGLCDKRVWSTGRKYFHSHRDAEASTTVGIGNVQSVNPVSPFFLRAMTWDASATQAAVKAEIDNAFTNNNWLILCFHRVVTSSPVSTDVLQSDLDALASYAKTKGVAIRTVGRVLAEAGERL